MNPEDDGPAALLEARLLKALDERASPLEAWHGLLAAADAAAPSSLWRELREIDPRPDLARVRETRQGAGLGDHVAGDLEFRLVLLQGDEPPLFQDRLELEIAPRAGIDDDVEPESLELELLAILNAQGRRLGNDYAEIANESLPLALMLLFAVHAEESTPAKTARVGFEGEPTRCVTFAEGAARISCE